MKKSAISIFFQVKPKQVLEKNFTIKVFEKLHSSMKKINMSKRRFLLHKMDLFKDYSHPDPFPVDMFLRLPLGSPDQAYLMLGTKGTGSLPIIITTSRGAGNNRIYIP